MAAKALKVHKPYPVPGCPTCGRRVKPPPLYAGRMTCPTCGTVFQIVAFDPPAENMAARKVAPMSFVAESGDAGPAPCAKHAQNAAEGTCERCGAFMCALCRTPLGGKAYCPDCFERVLRDGTDELGPTQEPFDLGIALFAGALGLVPCFGLILGPLAIVYGVRAMLAQNKGKASGGTLGIVVALAVGLLVTVVNYGFGAWIAYSIVKRSLG